MKYIFVINPLSGSGRGAKTWIKIKRILKKKSVDYTYFLTEHPGNIQEIVNNITLKFKKNSIVVIAVGGDGTIHELINALVLHPEIQIGYIPAGSGNDFAKGHDISKKPSRALERILINSNYPNKLFDLGIFSLGNNKDKMQHFVNCLAIGFDGEVTKQANNSKCKKILNKYRLGGLGYSLIALKLLFSYHPHNVKLIIDGKTKFYKNVWMASVNNIPFYGGGIKISPNAIPSDGILNVCIINDIPRWKVLIVYASVFFGFHYLVKGVTFLEGKDITVISDTEMLIAADGEIIGNTPVDIQIRTKIISVI